jgi:hypothetical protein
VNGHRRAVTAALRGYGLTEDRRYVGLVNEPANACHDDESAAPCPAGPYVLSQEEGGRGSS